MLRLTGAQARQLVERIVRTHAPASSDSAALSFVPVENKPLKFRVMRDICAELNLPYANPVLAAIETPDDIVHFLSSPRGLFTRDLENPHTRPDPIRHAFSALQAKDKDNAGFAWNLPDNVVFIEEKHSKETHVPADISFELENSKLKRKLS